MSFIAFADDMLATEQGSNERMLARKEGAADKAQVEIEKLQATLQVRRQEPFKPLVHQIVFEYLEFVYKYLYAIYGKTLLFKFNRNRP